METMFIAKIEVSDQRCTITYERPSRESAWSESIVAGQITNEIGYDSGFRRDFGATATDSDHAIRDQVLAISERIFDAIENPNGKHYWHLHFDLVGRKVRGTRISSMNNLRTELNPTHLAKLQDAFESAQ